MTPSTLEYCTITTDQDPIRRRRIYTPQTAVYTTTPHSPRTAFPISPSPHPSLLLTPLALDHRRAGVHIARGRRPVQLEQDARVGGLVGARERDQRARVERAGTARDGQLRAANVELRAADAAGRVQRDVLHAQEVVAVGDARGDGHRDLALACGLLSGWLGTGNGRGVGVGRGRGWAYRRWAR